MLTERKIVLTGHFAGRDVKLGDFTFVKGVLNTALSDHDFAMTAKFIERNWQGLPEGDPRLEVFNGTSGVQSERHDAEGQAEVHRDLQPEGNGEEGAADDSDGAGDTATGEAGSLADGDGHEDGLNEAPKAWVNERLKRAVLGLDHSVDSNWTKPGLPAISAVEKVYGAGDVTRIEIEAVAPGFVRNKE